MSESRISIAAEVATAVAAVTYPIARVVSGWMERRRARRARELARPAAAVEARLAARCSRLEARVNELEQELDKAA
jgi:hypothetical protein